MSDDKRLGSNPLNWVSQGPDAESGTPPVSASPTAITESVSWTSGLFKPAGPVPEEDFVGKDKIKIKQEMETAKVVGYLTDLAQSLESGVIRAENEETSVVLGVPGNVYFEMKLSRKKGKAKCEIEMEWQDDGSSSEELTLKQK